MQVGLLGSGGCDSGCDGLDGFMDFSGMGGAVALFLVFLLLIVVGIGALVVSLGRAGDDAGDTGGGKDESDDVATALDAVRRTQQAALDEEQHDADRSLHEV